MSTSLLPPAPAWVPVSPHCPCGMLLLRPYGARRPTSERFPVECECGRTVLARFWQQQEGDIAMERVTHPRDVRADDPDPPCTICGQPQKSHPEGNSDPEAQVPFHRYTAPEKPSPAPDATS